MPLSPPSRVSASSLTGRRRASRPEWLSPSIARTEVLAGLVVALALIPEAIAFSILAGVDPRVGLFASFTMAVTIAFTGGRPAMITAATGAIALVVAPLATHNLAYGVVAGSLTAMVLFARRVAHLVEVTEVNDPDGTEVIYSVHGELFFASSHDLVGQFDYAEDPDRVVIDLSQSHVWDASSVAALDAVTQKYARRGKTVRILGLNEASDTIHQRLSGQMSTH